MIPRFSRFSPHLTEPDILERLLVGREELLYLLVEGIVGTILEGGARYEVIIGGWGAGKSHLLAMLAHRLRARSDLRERAVIVQISEAEPVTSLLGLLAGVLRGMPREEGSPEPEQQVRALSRLSTAEGERRAVHMIRECLGERALVLVLEGLDRAFEALGGGGQQALRSILQEQGRWSIIASSQRLGSSLSQKNQPFYRMFSARTLEPLRPEACRELLCRLALLYGRFPLAEALRELSGLSRIRAIHHLTGGSPRAMVMMFPHLTPETLDGLLDAFFLLSDEVMPCYLAQTRARSPGQQAILARLTESWRPLSVNDLAEATLSSHSSTSSQLRYLRQDHIVTNIICGRESLYELADPLWRLSCAIQRGDDAARDIVLFLRSWYEEHPFSPPSLLTSEPQDPYPPGRPPHVPKGLPSEPHSAMSVIHSDIRPYSRLAASERQVIRYLLAQQGAQGEEILSRIIPIEPEP